jgi:hypothetical protein
MQRDASEVCKFTMRFVFLAAMLLVFAAGCARPPDEVLIRSSIETMRNAAEERRPAGVVGEIANDFTGNKGEIDREGLSRLLKFQFLRNESIGVAIGPVDVAVDGDRATAKFDVTFSDASQRWLPGGRETYAIVSGWRREGSRWICYNASWTHPT